MMFFGAVTHHRISQVHYLISWRETGTSGFQFKLQILSKTSQLLNPHVCDFGHEPRVCKPKFLHSYVQLSQSAWPRLCQSRSVSGAFYIPGPPEGALNNLKKDKGIDLKVRQTNIIYYYIISGSQLRGLTSLCTCHVHFL